MTLRAMSIEESIAEDNAAELAGEYMPESKAAFLARLDRGDTLIDFPHWLERLYVRDEWGQPVRTPLSYLRQAQESCELGYFMADDYRDDQRWEEAELDQLSSADLSRLERMARGVE